MQTIYKIMSQIATVTGIGFFALAYDWMYEGIGLNPLVAIPAAMLMLAVPYIFPGQE